MRAQFCAVIALLIFCILLAVYSYFDTLYLLESGKTSVFTPSDSARIVFLYSLIIGGIPTIVFCAPIYAWLSHKNYLKWQFILLLVLMPSLVFLTFEKDLFPLFIGAALFVAGLTHLLFRYSYNVKS
jgi:uncharacterized membrane protein